MVLLLDADAKDAVLSLCQVDILAKLQALTNDLNTKTDPSSVFSFFFLSRNQLRGVMSPITDLEFAPKAKVSLRRYSILNMADICSNQLLAHLIQVASATSSWLSPTCAFGGLPSAYSNCLHFSKRLTRCLAPTSRHLARSNLKPNQIPVTLTSFPRLGVPGKFTEPYYDPAGAVSSHSLFLPEQITNPHARFP